MTPDRYDRQRRITGWDQTQLFQARVLVAGAGALGNEVVKNLVLMGVGHILVIDFDRVERSNLSRTVLFRDGDVGRAKAEVMRHAAAQLNPEVDVRCIAGDLRYDVGLGFYRHVDLVVGGLDSLAARHQVGLSCALAGVPFLDGGLWSLGGEVRWFIPGDGPCFECTLDDNDHSRMFERQSCTGFRREEAEGAVPPVPTTISTAAIIGGLLAQEIESAKEKRQQALQLFIVTPDDERYETEASSNMLLAELRSEFLDMWNPLMTSGAGFYTLRQDRHAQDLKLGLTLAEAQIHQGMTLYLIAEPITPSSPVRLTIEDVEGQRYSTTVRLDTPVGQLTSAFMDMLGRSGKATVQLLADTAESQPVRILPHGMTLYDEHIGDGAHLRIWPTTASGESQG